MTDTNKTTDNNSSKKIKTHHGRNVQLCRELRGIKQPDLAQLIGISTRTMARYEGKNVLSDSILKKISEILNFSIEFMETLNSDSDLKVINVNEGGKLFTENSSSNDRTFESNAKNFEPNAKNYEPNAIDESLNKNYEQNAKDESLNKNYEPNSTDATTNNGIPVENYDKLYEMLMHEREKNIRLEIELEFLKAQK